MDRTSSGESQQPYGPNGTDTVGADNEVRRSYGDLALMEPARAFDAVVGAGEVASGPAGRHVTCPNETAGVGRSIASRRGRIMGVLTISREIRHDRVQEAIQTTRSELGLLSHGKGGRPAWLSQAEASLRDAEDAVATGDIDRGWGLVHRSEELSVHGYDSVRVTSEATTVGSELLSGKFTAWRQADIRRHLDHVLALNPQKDGWLLPLDQRRAWLIGAMRTRHEGYSNAYEDVALVRRYQAVLLAIAALILLGALAGSVAVNPSPTSGVDKWWMVLGAALGGALGGITSALQRTTRRSITRIPERLGSLVNSLSRPIVGAIGGVTVLLAVRAGITQTNNASQQQAAYVLLLAFGAGFSERLVVRDTRSDTANSNEVAARAAPPVVTTALDAGSLDRAGSPDPTSTEIASVQDAHETRSNGARRPPAGP